MKRTYEPLKLTIQNDNFQGNSRNSDRRDGASSREEQYADRPPSNRTFAFKETSGHRI